MTREEAIHYGKDYLKDLTTACCHIEDKHKDFVRMAIKTLEQESCEDAISLQAVLDLIADYDLSMGQVVKGIHALPPVTPQPKTGHWIDDMGLGYHVSICSNCNWRGHGDTCLIYKPKYCPNCGAKMVEPQESEETQPKQTDGGCLDFDFDKVKEILKRDDFVDLIVDHTCEEKQEQTKDEKMIDAIDFAIKATGSRDDYSLGMCNGMRYVKYLIDGKEPQYESRRTDEEIKFGINLGDEVVGDYGAKGVVVGIDTYKGEVLLSLLMRNHKVPQLVKASMYKTKTGRHFPQIIEVLEQIKGESDGK